MSITYFYRNHKVGYSIKKVSDLFVNKFEDKTIVEVPSPFASLLSILKNMYCAFENRNKKGINHITGDIHYCILPLMFCKTILTIHDCTQYDHTKGLKKIIIKYLWFVLPLKFATKVVCISESTRQAVRRFTKRDDILVITNAVDPTYKYVPKTFDANNVNILLIGTNWNKNIERTIQAVKDINCTLTIIGPLTNAQLEMLQKTNVKYINKKDLTDEQIHQEYVNCDIVSFCSLFEGFGMPIIEAQAVGRPVVTSNLAPMNEITGNGAMLVNPYDTNSVSNAIKKIISDERTRSSLIKHGMDNVEKFDLTSIVEQYKRLYKSLSC